MTNPYHECTLVLYYHLFRALKPGYHQSMTGEKEESWQITSCLPGLRLLYAALTM